MLAVAALATAIIAAGCGGDDGSTTETISDAKAEFIAAGDQICTDIGEQTNAAVQKKLQIDSDKPQIATDNQVVEIYRDITIPYLVKLFDQLAALDPPPGDEDEIQAILDSADDAIAKAKKDPAIIAKTPEEGNPFDESNELEQAYGFKVCGAVINNEA